MITISKSRKATSRPTSGPIDFHRAAERIKQVSNLTRLRVLLLLGEGERSVGAIDYTKFPTFIIAIYSDIQVQGPLPGCRPEGHLCIPSRDPPDSPSPGTWSIFPPVT